MVSVFARRATDNMRSRGGALLAISGTATATESPAGTFNLTGDGTNAAKADVVFNTVPGRSYRLTFTGSSSAALARIGSSVGGTDVQADTATVVGSNSVAFTAAGAQTWVRFSKLVAALAVVSGVAIKLR